MWRLGEKLPNFQANTTHGMIDFYDYIDNSWAILFSHPADFTPVCTTELGRVETLTEEFSKGGCKKKRIKIKIQCSREV